MQGGESPVTATAMLASSPPATESLRKVLEELADQIDRADADGETEAQLERVVDRLVTGVSDEDIAALASFPAIAPGVVQVLSAKDPPRGTEVADRLVVLAPTEPAFVQLAWETNIAVGRFDQARSLAEGLRRADPEGFLGHLLAGEADLQLGFATRAAEDADSAVEHFEAARAAFGDAISTDADDPRGWADRARASYQLRDFDAVVADAGEALRRDDQWAQVFNLRGLAHEAAGRLEAAKADYARATQLSPLVADAWRNLGDAQLGLGETTDAIASYTQAVELEPDNVVYRLLLAHAHRTAGQWQAVLDDLAPVEDAIAEDAAARNLRGLALTELAISAPPEQQQSTIADAIAEFDAALALAPRSAFILYFRARARYMAEDLDAAIADCDAAAALTPNDPDIYFLRGLVRGRAAALAPAEDSRVIALEGIGDFDRAYVLEPTGVRSPLYRGELRALIGEWVGARADYTLAITLNPDERAAHEGRARCAANLDDPAAAIVDFDALISLNGEDWRSRYQRGLAYAEVAARAGDSGDEAEAIRTVDLALADFDVAIERGAPESEAEARYYRGMARSVKARWLPDADAATRALEDSLDDFTRTIELAPTFERANLVRAQALVRLTRYDDAVADYDRALELDPDDIEGLTGRGIIHEIRGDFDLALDDYERVAELAPAIPQAWQNVGDALSGLGMAAEAAIAYTRCIELEPSNAKWYVSRAAAQAAAGDEESSIRDFDVALELTPDDASLYVKRGDGLTQLGEHERAIWDFDRALDLSPDEPEANLGRAFAHIRLGEGLADRGESAPAAEQFAMAIVDARRAIEIADDDPWTHRYLGFALRERSAYDLAYEAFSEAAHRSSEDESLRVLILADAADALRIWAHVAMDRPLIERAVDAFRPIVEAGGNDPSLAGAYLGLGEALIDLGDHAGAIEEFRHALRLDPDLRRAEVGMGTANLRLGRLRRARHWYGRATSEDSPVRDWAKVGYAVSIRRLGDRREAARVMRAVLRAKGKSGYVSRSGWLMDIGEEEAAIADARRAATIAPESSEAHNHLSWLLSTADPSRRQVPAAVRHGHMAVDLARDAFDRARALDTYAWALVVAGETPRAIPHLEEAISLDEFDVFPRWHLEQITGGPRRSPTVES